jgi:hypothetical protein
LPTLKLFCGELNRGPVAARAVDVAVQRLVQLAEVKTCQATRAGKLAPLHPRDNTFPGEVFLGVAADVLDWRGASRADPLALEGMRERLLPGCAFSGRQNKKLQFSILAAAALRDGAEPDLLDEVALWQTDDFWQYALYAAVAYIRAAAGRAGVPVRQVCRELAQRDGPQPG